MAAQSASPVILVVDDDENIRDALGLFFRMEGYQVVAAGDGEAALALMGRQPVDLVVSDVKMPVLDGPGLLAKIRGLPRRVPVILISGFADINEEDAKAKGAIALIPKPFHLDDILTAVRQSIGPRSGP